jgi:hypothetical protein
MVKYPSFGFPQVFKNGPEEDQGKISDVFPQTHSHVERF